MFKFGFEASRDPQKGYGSTFKAFIEYMRDRTVPVMDGSVKIDLSGQAVVEQMWEAVNSVMNHALKLVTRLLDTVGVSAEERSPSCREFSSCIDLRLRDQFFHLIAEAALELRETRLSTMIFLAPHRKRLCWNK